MGRVGRTAQLGVTDEVTYPSTAVRFHGVRSVLFECVALKSATMCSGWFGGERVGLQHFGIDCHLPRGVVADP